MSEPMIAMRERFAVLTAEQKDILRAIKLLAFGGILPFTHRRIAGVLRGVFDQSIQSLADCLQRLTEQAFLLPTAIRDPVFPEPGYLINVVSFARGANPISDLPTLKEVVAELGDVDALLQLGGSYGVRTQDHHWALSCFERAILISPDHHGAWYRKGLALAQLKRYEEAIAALRHALVLNSGLFEAWFDVGVCLTRLERLPEAIEAYENSIRIKPDYTDAFFNKSATLMELQRYDEALEAIDECIRIRPNVYRSLNLRGVVFSRIKRYAEAIKTFDQAIAINPVGSEALFNKGSVLLEQGNLQAAVEAFISAAGLALEDPRPWCGKGLALGRSGNKRKRSSPSTEH